MVAARSVHRGDVFLVQPTDSRGREIKKARPCVVVSPEELNRHLGTFIVAPMSTGSHAYPYRIACRFRGKRGHVILDQLRSVDRARMVRHLGRLSPKTLNQVLGSLQAMFAV